MMMMAFVVVAIYWYVFGLTVCYHDYDDNNALTFPYTEANAKRCEEQAENRDGDW